MSGTPLVYAKDVSATSRRATLPPGLTRKTFDQSAAQKAHKLLQRAYQNGFGDIACFENWYANLVGDDEYDADLCYLLSDETGMAAAFAQCWTSGFIKDLAVAPHCRGKGVATKLLEAIFEDFRKRGLTKVCLKVHPENLAAIALYEKAGMERVHPT